MLMRKKALKYHDWLDTHYVKDEWDQDFENWLNHNEDAKVFLDIDDDYEGLAI